jgi:septal ring factor EnvC (AmiA/AmiB activator)
MNAAKEKTLNELGEMMERGFAAIASDIAEIKTTMATQEDVRAIVRDELTPIRADLKAIRDELDDLRERVENVSGYRKEIDHALERIAAIEKRVGIEKKIAA